MMFACRECLDTGTIDRGGAEIRCPYCEPLVRLTGLGRSLGLEGAAFITARRFTPTTIEFYGRREDVLADVRHARRAADMAAARRGLKGRNYVSSGVRAIERRVLAALPREETR